MEPFQRRRSKITSFTGDLLGSTEPAFREGQFYLPQKKKEKVVIFIIFLNSQFVWLSSKRHFEILVFLACE